MHTEQHAPAPVYFYPSPAPERARTSGAVLALLIVVTGVSLMNLALLLYVVKFIIELTNFFR